MNFNIVIIAIVVIVAALAIIHFHLLPKIEAMLHKHAAATNGGVTVTSTLGVSTGDANSIGPTQLPPSHGATPPANSGAVGSLVGQPVPNCGTPDADGCIPIPAIAKKFAPGSRFVTVLTLPYVPVGSAAAFQIAANCSDSAESARITGLAQTVAFAPVPNPPTSAAVGGASFHLAGQAPGEKQVTIPNAITIPSTLTTLEQIVAYYAHQADYGVNAGDGSGFSPNH